MEKYGFVYIWFDSWRKMYYVGSHWGHENDGYVCSSTRMRKAYRRRPQDFKRRILSKVTSSKQDLLDEEYRYLSMIDQSELGLKYYNLTNHKNGHWTTVDEKVKSLRERISIKTKEAMYRPEVRQKYLQGLETRDNRSSDPLVLDKRRSSMKETMAKKFPIENRKKHMVFSSEEYNDFMREHTSKMWKSRSERDKQVIGDKISKSLLGKQNRLGHINTEEHKAKISQSLKGKKFSEERKAKLHKPRKKWSEEQKLAHSERIKKSWVTRKKHICQY